MAIIVLLTKEYFKKVVRFRHLSYIYSQMSFYGSDKI
ncbi:hypothetical protein C8P67_107103 [Flavobacterium aquicola]|uniref:Uncharacterized protein n=1 Tax=Flavobacterium aquicola TaxID=1682742 RepID=A0A3E0EIT4_9FLAO|nr:hypothetical protein C8P67_107103 [Flavobacterium aquicola]